MAGQSSDLTQFYRSYKDWLDNGAPSHEPFSRSTGLCGALQLYHLQNNLNSALYFQLHNEMNNQFEVEVNEDSSFGKYPFGGSAKYLAERNSATQHLNQERIDWVNAHV